MLLLAFSRQDMGYGPCIIPSKKRSSRKAFKQEQKEERTTTTFGPGGPSRSQTVLASSSQGHKRREREKRVREREGRLKRERGAHSGRGETKVGGRGRRNSNVQQKLLFMHSLRKEKKKRFFLKGLNHGMNSKFQLTICNNL